MTKRHPIERRCKRAASGPQAHTRTVVTSPQRMEEATAMAISFPAPESQATIKGRGAPAYEGPAVKASRLVGAGRMLEHFRQRVFSAIFDADGNCMRL